MNYPQNGNRPFSQCQYPHMYTPSDAVNMNQSVYSQSVRENNGCGCRNNNNMYTRSMSRQNSCFHADITEDCSCRSEADSSDICSLCDKCEASDPCSNGCGSPDKCTDTFLSGLPKAMAYVPYSCYEDIAAPAVGFVCGTIFKQLYFDFKGRRCN